MLIYLLCSLITVWTVEYTYYYGKSPPTRNKFDFDILIRLSADQRSMSSAKARTRCHDRRSESSAPAHLKCHYSYNLSGAKKGKEFQITSCVLRVFHFYTLFSWCSRGLHFLNMIFKSTAYRRIESSTPTSFLKPQVMYRLPPSHSGLRVPVFKERPFPWTQARDPHQSTRWERFLGEPFSLALSILLK